MGLESNVNGIEDLNPAWPESTDNISEGDQQIQNVKKAVQGSFPNMNGANNIGAALSVGTASLEAHAVPLGQMSSEIAAYLDGMKIQAGRVDQTGAEVWDSATGTTVIKEATGVFLLSFASAASATEAQAVFIQPLFNQLNGINAGYEAISAQQIRVYTERLGDSGNNYIAHDIGFAYVRLYG